MSKVLEKKSLEKLYVVLKEICFQASNGLLVKIDTLNLNSSFHYGNLKVVGSLTICANKTLWDSFFGDNKLISIWFVEDGSLIVLDYNPVATEIAKRIAKEYSKTGNKVNIDEGTSVNAN
jgi:hypothetical protein